MNMAIVSFTNYKRGQTRGGMGAVMRYTAQEWKTEHDGRQLVTGINCQPETVYGDFMTTKYLHHKADGTMFYHMVQSFPKGEKVDSTVAHAAALKLAEYFADWCVRIRTVSISTLTSSSTRSASRRERNCTSQKSSFKNCASATMKCVCSSLCRCSYRIPTDRKPNV